MAFIELLIVPAAGGLALLVMLFRRRHRDARTSAEVGAAFQVSTRMDAPGWELLFDDKGRQLAVVSAEMKAVVPYDTVHGWRREPRINLVDGGLQLEQVVQIGTHGPHEPVIEIPLGTDSIAVADRWLARLDANVHHRPTARPRSPSGLPA